MNGWRLNGVHNQLLSLVICLSLVLAGCTGGKPFAGCTWRIVQAPEAGPDGDALSDVLAFSDTDVWVAGPVRDDHHAHLYRWDGAKWNDVPTPQLDAATNVVSSLAGTGRDDVWASGIAYPLGNDSRSSPFMLHWDGIHWSLVLTPDLHTQRVSLSAVAAVAPNDAWAVGAYGAHGDHALAEHWNGHEWKLSLLPLPSRGPDVYDRLFDVAASSPNDVWALGWETGQIPMALHWDGAEWRRFDLPSPLSMAQRPPHIVPADLRKILPLGHNDAWFAGSGYRSRVVDGRARAEEPLSDAIVPVLLHWGREGWSTSETSSSAVRGNGYELFDASRASGRAWVVGTVRLGEGITTQPLVYELRGSAWEPVVTPSIAPAPLHMDDFRENGFLAVSATPDGHAWAVGRYYTADFRGILPLVERCS